jgi:hypothetical protein
MFVLILIALYLWGGWSAVGVVRPFLLGIQGIATLTSLGRRD